MFTQQLCDALMELNMVINVAGASLHGANQRQLLVVNVFNQLREIVVAVACPGTSQVRGIAVVLCARIQQEATHFGWRTVIQLGVVQYGRMLIQRHDIAVRDVGIAMTGRRQVSLINIELAHPRLESFVGRAMAVHRRFLRFTHTGQLIVGFVSAIIVQIVDNAFRVDFVCRDLQT